VHTEVSDGCIGHDRQLQVGRASQIVHHQRHLHPCMRNTSTLELSMTLARVLCMHNSQKQVHTWLTLEVLIAFIFSEDVFQHQFHYCVGRLELDVWSV